MKGQTTLYRINSVTGLFCKLNHNLMSDVHISALCDQPVTVGEQSAENIPPTELSAIKVVGEIAGVYTTNILS